MKKLTAIVLSLILLLSACAFAEADEQIIAIGSTGIVMTIPADYAAGEITEEDTDESQIAYYKSETYLVDFDIYQWAKAEGETLEAAAAAEAAEYGAELTETEFNGIQSFYYEATEESEGTEYPTVSFLFANGAFFGEIVFWLDGEGASDVVEGMVDTLTLVDTADIDEGGNVVALGTTELTITLPAEYKLGEITEEDTDENQVAYYYSDESTIDFDVYQWAKAEGETLETAAAAEAAEFGTEAEAMTIGELTVYTYGAVEESEGTEYATLTCMTEDGDNFVEIVFWLDGENAEETVADILLTLAK